MIGYIKGKTAGSRNGDLLIDRDGIGFLVKVPAPVFERYRDSRGEDITLQTSLYTNFDQNIAAMYGFTEETELRFFELLLTVKGVGPRAAIAVLSVLSPYQLYHAVLNEDIASIKKAPGVGERTARQVVLDLKSKLLKDEVLSAVSSAPDDSGVSGKPADVPESVKDARAALEALGYKPAFIDKAIENAEITRDMATDQILEIILKGID